MQSTIYFLQQQLKEAKETIANLQQQQQMAITNAAVVMSDKPEHEDTKEEKLEDEPGAEKESEKDCKDAAKEAESPNTQGLEQTNADDNIIGKDEGQSTPTKAAPSKRGRVTRGQKREVGFSLACCVT